MSDIKITPAVINITIPMATTLPLPYTFKRIDGTPIDISNATLLFTVKEQSWDSDSGDNTAKIKKELVITDGANGKAKLFLTQQETFIDAGSYFYDIKIVQPVIDDNTTVDVAVMGSFTITADSTNRVIGIS